MHPNVQTYNESQTTTDNAICTLLANLICKHIPLAENKVWHGHPVWFLEGNPIVGYAKQKNSVKLLFWSGQSFDEVSLVKVGSFKMGQLSFTDPKQIDESILIPLFTKAQEIQWDYKNIVKRKGVLERLK